MQRKKRKTTKKKKNVILSEENVTFLKRKPYIWGHKNMV